MRWKPGLLYFSLKAVNLHKSALQLDVLWLTQLPQLQSTSGLFSYQAPKRYKDAFTLCQFLDRVTSAEPNWFFPWLNKDYWEHAPKCGGISAGWIPAAPDCACSLRRAPWWAITAMVLSPNSWVWNIYDSCVSSVSRGSCARTRVSAGLQQDNLSAFHVPMRESAYLPASPALAYFLHTLLTLACGILSPKLCLHFFSNHISCSHLRCHLTQCALPLCPLTITLLHRPLLCYSLTLISVAIELWWHWLPLKGSTDPFHVLKFSSDP